VSELNLAILGAGYMGGVHALSWTKVPGAKIKVIYSRTKEKAEILAKKYGAEASSSWREVVSRNDVDVVDICLPTFMHKEVCIESLKREKHVLLEKPLATSLEEAYEIMKTAEKARTKVMVAHCLRFFPVYSKIKSEVSRGALGEIISVRAMRSSTFPTWGSNAWFKDPEKSGSFFADLLIHDFDYIRWLVDAEAKKVVARITPKPVWAFVRPSDYGVAKIFFENGVIAHVEGGWAMPKTWLFTMHIEVYGSEGYLEYNSVDSNPLFLYTERSIELIKPGHLVGYELEIAHFAECILKDKEPMVSLVDAYKALELSLAALKSSLSREPVSLPLRKVKT